ncbi:hypothetical protein HPP92_007490 [Vanilla planifolia]|uniref:WPP domain-interacting protein 2 n=1 Tax=Vanilla planifolia TaxID=51239 RepID=A0A835V5Y6_VANPL|nr:hypothetical protein HPP92_007490 [Vanilla planifolia]
MDLGEILKSRSVEREEIEPSSPKKTLPLEESWASCNGDIRSLEQREIDSSFEIELAGRFGEIDKVGCSAEATNDTLKLKEAPERNGFIEESEESIPRTVVAPSAKGQGLRKWKRIRRNLLKHGSGKSESAQIMKRRLPIDGPSKAGEEKKLISDIEAEAKDSVASLGSKNTLGGSVPACIGLLEQELKKLASSGFSIGMDSDNSEDRSSRFSTAASAPRARHEEQRRNPKTFGLRASAHAVQLRDQLLGRAIDFSKTYIEGKIKSEKENSYSSVESDLRSSPDRVLQQGAAVRSSGKHGDCSLNFVSEVIAEAHSGGRVMSGYFTENTELENPPEGLNDKLLEEDTEKTEHCIPPSDHDPFVKSIALLQETQEALENELLMVAAIGKDPVLSEEASHCPTFDIQLKELNKKVEHLESILEEASKSIKAKEQKVVQLEAIVWKSELPELEIRSDKLFLEEHQEAMESELEVLIMKSMEAEIEYLILAKTSHSWKVLAEDRFALFKEQLMPNLSNVEHRASLLKEQTERLEAYCEGLRRTEKVLTLQNMVFKLSLCYFFQLLVFCLAFGLFLMRLLPSSDWVVPT